MILQPDDQNESSKQSTGSLNNSEPVYLQVGVLRKTHGVRGDLVMDILTDFPERLVKGKKVFIGDKYQPVRIARIRTINDKLLINLAGYNDPESAAELRNWAVYVKASDLPALAEGEYYHHQLLGMRIVNENDDYIGVLEEILETGANEVYLIRAQDGAEVLVPAIPEFVKEVDLQARTIRIKELNWG